MPGVRRTPHVDLRRHGLARLVDFAYDKVAFMGIAGMALERHRTQFWGEGPAHVDSGSFSFHRLTARGPEDEVERHMHVEAHFVLVLSGGYISSAVGAPIVSSAPLLVF